MSEINRNEPAFPLTHEIPSESGSARVIRVYRGISVRDYFAAKALQAVVGSIMPHERHGWNSSDFAREAYELADAMLAERAK